MNYFKAGFGIVTRKVFYALACIALNSLSACQSNDAGSDAAEMRAVASSICKPPSRYRGNHLTNQVRRLDVEGTVIAQMFEYTIVPAKYAWIDGEHKGSSISYQKIPPVFKVETERHGSAVKECPSREVLFDCDEKTKMSYRTITRRIEVAPMRIEKCETPFLHENGRTRIVVEPSRVTSRSRTEIAVD